MSKPGTLSDGVVAELLNATTTSTVIYSGDEGMIFVQVTPTGAIYEAVNRRGKFIGSDVTSFKTSSLAIAIVSLREGDIASKARGDAVWRKHGPKSEWNSLKLQPGYREDLSFQSAVEHVARAITVGKRVAKLLTDAGFETYGSASYATGAILEWVNERNAELARTFELFKKDPILAKYIEPPLRAETKVVVEVAGDPKAIAKAVEDAFAYEKVVVAVPTDATMEINRGDKDKVRKCVASYPDGAASTMTIAHSTELNLDYVARLLGELKAEGVIAQGSNGMWFPR